MKARPLRARLQIAQCCQLLVGGRRRSFERVRKAHVPTGVDRYLLPSYPRVHRCYRKLSTLRVRAHDAQVRNHQCRPGSADAQPLSVVAPLTEAERGYEIYPLNEGTA